MKSFIERCFLFDKQQIYQLKLMMILENQQNRKAKLNLV